MPSPLAAPASRFARMLTVLERYTKTDMTYALSGSAWLGLGQAGAAIALLLLAVVFAHVLPKEVYGTYKYVLSVAAVVSVCSFSGLSTSIARAAAQGDESALARGFRTYLRTGLVMTVIAAAVGAYYLAHGNQTLGVGMLIAGIFLPVMGAANLYDAHLQGKRQFLRSGILTIVNVGLPALVLAIVALQVREPLPLIAAYFVGNAAVELALYLYVRRAARRSAGGAQTDTYSAHLSAMNVLTTFSTQIDQILVFHVLGPAQLAIYAFAIAIPEQMKGLLKNVGAIALPKYAHDGGAVQRASLVRKTLVFAIGIAVIAGVYVLIAPYLFAVLFPQYLASVHYSQLFALALIGGASVLPTSYLQARKETRRLYAVTITTAVLQVLLIAWGVWAYGLMGVVLARIVARAAGALIALTVAVR